MSAGNSQNPRNAAFVSILSCDPNRGVICYLQQKEKAHRVTGEAFSASALPQGNWVDVDAVNLVRRWFSISSLRRLAG
jgi:hypothetical protein